MSLRKLALGAAVTLSMVSTPVLASTASALPAADATRSGAQMTDANELGSGGWFIPLVAILAIIAGILAATSGDDDRPTSP